MNEPSIGMDYLDGIFAAIRGFGAEMAAARAWSARARSAPRAWQAVFLGAAVAAEDRAAARLAELRTRLGALGNEGSWPPPLDRLAANLAMMSADLEAHRVDFASKQATETLAFGSA